MLIVVRQGNKYGPEYVDVLRKQAKQTSGLDTLVLGDQDDADIQLEGDYPGWWSKINLFRPDIPKPFIYIDLDSFILGDISPLLGKTLIAKEWVNPKAAGRVQSSLIAINEDRSDIWEQFIAKSGHWMGQFYGDQKYLELFDWDYIQDIYPGMVGSYKYHNKERPIHRVVTFHGRPKQCDATGWAQDLWNSLKPQK